MQKKFYLIILMAIVLSSCAHIGTIKSDINQPEFQAENLPIRELRVWVYYEDYCQINKLSDLMEAQVGIRLNMTKYTPVEWESIGLLSRIEQMYDINNSTDFDIAIGFGHLTGPEAFMMLLGMPMAFGMIDDTYRRFITLKTMETEITLHEIYHSVILNHAHSLTGVMPALDFKIFPGLPSLNMGNYLTKADREEVLRNKWRDFSTKVLISEEYQRDIVGSK